MREWPSLMKCRQPSQLHLEYVTPSVVFTSAHGSLAKGLHSRPMAALFALARIVGGKSVYLGEGTTSRSRKCATAGPESLVQAASRPIEAGGEQSGELLP